MTITKDYEFWLADMFHYTVTANVNTGEPVAVWYDDLDHPDRVLEWEAASGQSPGKDAATAVTVFRERKLWEKSLTCAYCGRVLDSDHDCICHTIANTTPDDACANCGRQLTEREVITYKGTFCHDCRYEP